MARNARQAVPTRKPRESIRWVLSLTFFFALWYVLIWIFRFPEYVLPSPATVAGILWRDAGLLFEHARMTMFETVIGFALALVIGIVVALVMHTSKVVRYLAYPHLVLLQAIPLIAVAPIVLVWFGFGPLAKILVVAFVCFFPIAVNAYEGFRSVDPAYRELLDTFGASRLARYRHLYLPASVPGILSGAKIAATYSVLGAVIGEWLGGSRGIGVYMTRAQRSFRNDRLFAAIVIVMVLSLGLFKIVEFVGERLTPWLRRKS
ncbi:ABC transporter permease [Candidatus Bipolaricaulota bacterium]|nr:ABC transporter permease [Candidatus Bipolaricaulota bacterium]